MSYYNLESFYDAPPAPTADQAKSTEVVIGVEGVAWAPSLPSDPDPKKVVLTSKQNIQFTWPASRFRAR
jgi:hypothetical protein